jgi:hypothetical protein
MPRIARKPPQHQDTLEWPVDRHAEQIVLGHAIEHWQTLKARIGPDLFEDQTHRRIFCAMLELEGREEPVDKQTISQQLARNGLKDGDISLLAQLRAASIFSHSIPTSRSWRTSARCGEPPNTLTKS